MSRGLWREELIGKHHEDDHGNLNDTDHDDHGNIDGELARKPRLMEGGADR